MHRKALFPGTFDPITLGHADLIARAARLFDELVVAVAESPRKNTLFSLQERVGMAREVLAALPNVHVEGFSTLLTAYAHAQGASVIARGVRTVADFEYEMQMVGINRTLNPALEVIFLTPDPKYHFVSSTHVREITLHGGDASSFVAPQVWQALLSKRS